jgi:hypothetical protein
MAQALAEVEEEEQENSRRVQEDQEKQSEGQARREAKEFLQGLLIFSRRPSKEPMPMPISPNCGAPGTSMSGRHPIYTPIVVVCTRIADAANKALSKT